MWAPVVGGTLGVLLVCLALVWALSGGAGGNGSGDKPTGGVRSTTDGEDEEELTDGGRGPGGEGNGGQAGASQPPTQATPASKPAVPPTTLPSHLEPVPAITGHTPPPPIVVPKPPMTTPPGAPGPPWASGGGKTHTVWKRIRKRGDGLLLENVKEEDIYCVEGDYDHVEQVLARLQIPRTIVPAGGMSGLLGRISPDAVLIVNCSNGRNLAEGDITRFRQFVHRGGYLFTSDWELRNTIQVVLPGYITRQGETGAHEFPIRPDAKATNHPYLRDVFPKDRQLAGGMKWKIDPSSYTVKTLRGGVISLIVCDRLGAQYGSNIVACTFRFGEGSVLHVLGHFEKQMNPADDRFALLQLLVNFIVEKQKARQAKTP